MKKKLLFRLVVLFIVSLFLHAQLKAQDCSFTTNPDITPVTCPGNGQITVNLSDTAGKGLSTYRYSLFSSSVNITGQTSNVFGGLSAGTYMVVVNAFCNAATVGDTVRGVVVPSSYTTPDAGLVQGTFTSAHPYGTVPSFSCGATGQMQIRIENGTFPYTVEISRNGSVIRTDVFNTNMYNGNNPNNYDYKDYYTIENLSAGDYSFSITDGCGYTLPFVTGNVPSVTQTFDKKYIYMYQDPGNIAASNVLRLSLFQGIAGDANLYYYAYSQLSGSNIWWEYALSIDGGSTFSSWKDITGNGVLLDTINSISSYCSLYGKTVQVKVRDKICNKEYTQNFSFKYPGIKSAYQYTTDSSQVIPASYDTCGYITERKILSQHTSSYYQQVNSYKANQVSNSTAAFYYTPPLTITTTNITTGTQIGKTTQSSASYNWRQNVNITPEMDGNTINITVTDKNGCMISDQNQIVKYEIKNTVSGGQRNNTTWQVTSTSQNWDECGETARLINVVRTNPSPEYLDSTVVQLVASPNNNQYNFTAIYRTATNQWTVTKDDPANTAEIYGGNPVANTLEISAIDLISGTYRFIITDQCKSTIIEKTFNFPVFLSVTQPPTFTLNLDCGFLNVIPTGGQIQANGVNTTTYFKIIYGEAGGYPTAGVTVNNPLPLSIRGTYTLRMYSNINENSSCGTYDTVITYPGSNLNIDYLFAYTCGPSSTTVNLNTRGTLGKPPYTYTVYSDANGSNVIGSNTRGDFTSIPGRLGDVIYLGIEDACGASFITPVTVVNLESARKAWFENNNSKTLSICQGDTAILNGLSMGDVSYQWTGPNGFIATQQNTELRIPRSLAEEGWYYLNVQNSYCPIVADSVYLNILEAPSVTLLDNAAICPGEMYTIQMTSEGTGEINFTVVHEVNSILTERTYTNRINGQVDTINISPLNTNRFWIKQVQDGQCAYNVPEDTIAITIKSISSSCNISAPPQEVCYNTNAVLNATSSLETPYIVKWYRDSTLNVLLKTETIEDSEQASYTVSNLTKDTTFYITAQNAAFCEYKPGVTVASVNMNNGITNINCGESVRFYDSGGATGNYGNQENLVHTFVSAAPGNPVNIAFSSFITESANFDKMYIYDGGSIHAPVLASALGGNLNNNLPGTITSTGDSLTVQFISNFNNNFAGWDAIVGVKNGPVPVYANVLDAVADTISSSEPLPLHYNGSTVLTAHAWGGRGTSYSYQWYTSPDNSSWTPTGIITATYTVTNLTSPTYYRCDVLDNSSNACPGIAVSTFFLDVADINLSLDLTTDTPVICPGDLYINIAVRNTGTEIADNVVVRLNLPDYITQKSTGENLITINAGQIPPQQTMNLPVELTADVNITPNEPILQAQIWSCDQGDNDMNTVYGDWNWTGTPRQKDEDTLAITLKRAIANNNILTFSDSVCYGNTAILEASANIGYPQTVSFYRDSLGQTEIGNVLLPDNTSPASFSIANLIQDTTIYVTVTNTDVCGYTVINQNELSTLLMQDGKTTVQITDSIRFYDSGGSTGNYKANENHTHTFTSSFGDMLRIRFDSFHTESSTNDFLYIYDGNSTTAPLLTTVMSGNLSAEMPLAFETSGNSLTVSFQSGSTSATNTGWAASITTVQQLKPIKAVVKKFADPASVKADSVGVCYGSNVALKASSPIAFPQTFNWYSDQSLTNLVYSETVDGTSKTLSTYTLSNQTADTLFYITVGNLDSCNLTNEGLAFVSYQPAIAKVTVISPVVSITGADSICAGQATTLSPVTGGTWISNNTSIATVSNSGMVTSVGSGHVTFTFTDNKTGCSITTDTIVVNPVPELNVQNISICAGSNANLTNAASATGGSTLYFYTDPNGNSYISNPEIYPGIIQTTTFYVKAAYDATSCSSEIKSFSVTVNPVSTITVKDLTVCAGSNVNLMNAIVSSSGGAVNFYAEQTGHVPIPDPNIENITSTTLFYVKPINETTHCSGVMSSFTVYVIANPDLILTSGSDNQTLCEGDPLETIVYNLVGTTTATVSGLPQGVTYTLNSGIITISGTPTQSGSFTFNITTGQTSCPSKTITGTITINPKPSVAFTYSFDDPVTVHFSDQSVVHGGQIASWYWDFGDGTNATGKDQRHVYAGGDYVVKLIITSDKGCVDSATQNIHTGADINVDFNIGGGALQCVNGNAYLFTSQVTIKGGSGNPSYLWDFGDGTTSTLANPPAHTYAYFGAYTVKLTVTDIGGSQTGTKVALVEPAPSVQVQNLTMCSGDTVDLRNAVNTSSLTTSIFYSDPRGQTQIQDPVISGLTSTTRYYVKRVYFVTGCESVLVPFDVIINPLPTVEVIADQLFVCLGDVNTNLNDAIVSQSSGSNLIYYTNDTIRVLNPNSITINQPSFFLVKAVDTTTGCESELKLIRAVPLVRPSLTTQNITSCSGSDVVLNDAITSFHGSKLTFYSNAAGTNEISNIVSGINSTTTFYTEASDTTSGCKGGVIPFNVTVSQSPGITSNNIQICTGASADLRTSTTEYPNSTAVFYSDAAGFTPVVNPQSVAGITGDSTFYVRNVDNTTQCSSELISFIVKVNPLPTVTVQDITICSGNSVDLRNAINTVQADTLIYYSDAAGINSIVNPNNVQGILRDTTYSVKAIYNATQCESVVSPFNIQVNPAATLALFSEPGTDDQQICEKSTLDTIKYAFTGATGASILGLPSGVTADINSGMVTITGTPTQTGEFTYMLATTGQYPQCSADTAVGTIIINPTPAAAFTYDVNTVDHLMVSFTDQSTINSVNSDNINIWYWNFGDQNGISVLQNDSYIYPVEGNYNVTLKISSNKGCVDSVTHQIHTSANVKVDFDIAPTQQCAGNAIEFTNKSTITGAIGNISYLWNFGDGVTSNQKNTIHTYSQPGTYTVTLTVSVEGSTSQTGSKVVTINPLPPIITYDISICSGTPANLNTAVGLLPRTSQFFYYDAAGTVPVLNPGAVNLTSDTTIYAKILYDITGCESELCPFRVNVNPLPFVNTHQIAICLGSTADLTTAITSSSQGSTLTYYRDYTLSTRVLSPDIVNGINTNSLFYVQAINDGTGCKSIATPIPVVVQVLPTISLQNIAICAGSDADLKSAIISYEGTEVKFYADAAGATPVADVVPGITTTTTYYAKAIDVNTSCEGEMKSFNVTVNPVPAVITHEITICLNKTVDLTTAIITTGGTTSQFYADAAGANPIQNPNAVNGIISDTTFFVRVINNSTSCQTELLPISVRVNPLPELTVQNIAICAGANTDLSTTVLTTTGDSLVFYSDEAGTTPVTNPEAISDIKVNTAYYVKAIISATGCESLLKSVIVMVNPLPQLTLTNIRICNGTNSDLTTAISNASSDEVLFYADAVGTIQINNPTAVEGITSDSLFYAKAKDNNTLCESLLMPFNVLVDPAPSIIPIDNNTPVCLGEEVMIRYQLINTTGANVTGLPLNIATSVNQDTLIISGISAEAGTFNYVINTTGQNASCSSLSNSGSITINPTPTAAYTYIVNPENPLNVSFTDKSAIPSGSISSWAWNFADEQTSSLQNSTHEYALAGSYDVSLITSTNAGCSDTVVHTIETNSMIQVDFDIDDSVQCMKDNRFVFNARPVITGAVSDTTYLWDFGDGQTSTQKNVVHQYVAPGFYPVTLTITTSGSTQTGSKIVTVYPTPPISVHNLTICEGTPTVNLNEAVDAVNLTTLFYYADPQRTQTISNPNAVAGITSDTTFYVEMLYDFNGCYSELVPFSVRVNPMPVLETRDLSACIESTIALTDAVVSSSSKSKLYFYSDFEGNTPILNPKNITINGTSPFWVKAVDTVTGCETPMHLFSVIEYTMPTITVQNISVCTGSDVDLMSAVTNFEGTDVLFYSDAAGNTQISSTVSTLNARTTFYAKAIYAYNSCESSLTSFIVDINSLPTLTVKNIELCIGEEIDLNTAATASTGSLQFFSDPAGSIRVLNPESVEDILSDTIFYVKSVNESQCESDMKSFIVKANPIPDVQVQDIAICEETSADLTTAVTSTSGDVLIYYSDAAGTITVENPTNVTDITVSTLYYVKAVNSNTSCVSELKSFNVIPASAPSVILAYTNAPICEGESLMIKYALKGTLVTTVTGLPSGIDYQSVADTLIISGISTVAGNIEYTINTIGQNAPCSSIQVTGNAVIHPKPMAAFTYQIGSINPLEVTFTDNSVITGGQIDYWKWSFGDGDEGSGQKTTHEYIADNNYTVTLTVTSSDNCSNTTTHIVKTSPGVYINFGVNDSSQCLNGNSFEFTALPNIAGATTDTAYLWNFGDGSTSTRKNPVHSYTVPGSYLVKLTVRVNGISQSASHTVFVNPNPVINTENIVICGETESVDLTTAVNLSSTTSADFYRDREGLIPVINPEEVPDITSTTRFYTELTNTNTQCSSTLDSFDVVVNPLPTLTVQNMNVCYGTQVDLRDAATYDPGHTLSFYKDQAGITPVVNPNSVNITVLSTFYVKSVNPATSCESELKMFSITPTALPTISVQNIDICFGADADLESAVIAHQGASLEFYTDPSGTIPTPNVVSNPLHSTSYYVQSVDAGGCKSVLTSFIMNVNPSPATSITGTVSVCEEATTILTALPAGGSWLSLDTTVAKVSAMGVVTGVKAGSAEVRYKAQNIYGCSDSSSAMITVNALPSISISGDQILCGNTTTQLAATPVGGTWKSLNPDIASVNSSGLVSANLAGQAIIQYTVPSTEGCMDSSTFTITVNPIPVIDPVADYTYCAGTVVPVRRFTGNLSTASFSWQRLPGSDIIQGLPESGNGPMPSFTATNNGVADLNAEYRVIMTNTVSGVPCEDTTTFRITVYPIPTVIPVNDIIICNGSSLNIPFSGNAEEFRWSFTAGQDIGIPKQGTDNPLSVGEVTISGNKALTANYQVIPVTSHGLMECIGNTQLFEIKVRPHIINAFSGNDTICVGETTNLSITFNGDSPWTVRINDGVKDTTISNITRNPYVFTVTPSQTTTYNVVYAKDAYCENDGLEGISATVSLHRQAIAADVTTVDDTVCNGNAATLTASSTIPGVEFTWYASNDPTSTLLATGATYTTGTLSNDTVFYVSAKNDTLCENQAGALKAVNVKVNSYAVAANITTVDDTICNGGTATLAASSTIAGVEFIWYASNDPSSTLLATGATYTTGALTSDATFYVSIKNDTLCENQAGTLKAVNVKVNPYAVAADITAMDDTVCTGNTTTLLASSNLQNVEFTWYADNDPASTVLATGSIYTTGALTNDTVFYVSIKNDTLCENQTGTLKAVNIKVNRYAVAADITAVDDTICTGNTATLSASSIIPGVEFTWYESNDPTSTVLATGTTYTTGALTNDATFYVSIKNDTCCENQAGALKAVNVKVNRYAVASDITTVDDTICSGNAATLSASSTIPGVEFTWYASNDPTSTLLATGATYTTETLTSDTTFYVSAKGDMLCENQTGTLKAVNVKVYEAVIATISMAGNDTICSKESVDITLNFTGTSPWNIKINNGERDTTFTNITSNPYVFRVQPIQTTTYRLLSVEDIYCTNNNLEDSLTVVVYPIPTIEVPDTLVYCHGELVPSYIFDNEQGAIYHWERVVGQDFGLVATEGTGAIPSFTALNTGAYPLLGIYKAWAENAGDSQCTSAEKQFVIAVNPMPMLSPEDIKDRTYCNQSIISEYTFSGDVVGANYLWEHESGAVIQGIPESGMNVLPLFTAINTTNSPITATYKVTADFTYAGRTCNNGDTARFDISIVPNPNVEVNLPHQTICSGNATEVITFTGTVAGTTYRWEWTSEYIPGLPTSGTGNFPSQELINTGETALHATYQVTPVFTLNNVTCEGLPKVFSITVNPSPFVYSIPEMAYCPGERVESYNFGNVTGVTYAWEKQSGDNVGLPQSGTGPLPSFVTTDNGSTALTARYKVTAEYTYENTVCEKDTVFDVTVNARPVTTAIQNYVYCANDTVAVLDFRTLFSGQNPEGTTYHWQYESGNPIGLSQTSGTNTMPSFVTLNASQEIITAVYQVKAVYGNCEGIATRFTISISGDARITRQPQSQLKACDGLTEFTLSVEAIGAGLQYQWYFNGNALTGETNADYTALYTEARSGRYHVEITTACGTRLVSNDAEVSTNTIVVERKWDDVLFIRDRESEYVSYQWYKDGKAISLDGHSQYYTEPGGFNGSYYVKAYYADGVTYDETCPLTIERSKAYKVTLYPNPAQKDQVVKLRIDSDNDEDITGEVEIFDVTGRRVYNGQVRETITELPIKLHSGGYVVRVSHKNGKVTIEKLIVK